MAVVRSFAVVSLSLGLASVASADITIPTVPIGNPGHAADWTGLGSVAYSYNIGATEVTNAQYAAFLNAVAATDTYALYNTNMAGSYGGITRANSPGSYTYSTVSGRENNPVNFVSFWDACRFANWLHNGQPTGPQDNSTTETGAYTLGGVTDPFYGNVTRNAGWQWAVTSENEWYKAAYHQPAGAGGDSDNYWQYPTSSNSVPTSSQANLGGSNFNTTPAGSYAANFYGTFDMGGNVWEWTEIGFEYSDIPGVRGGAWGSLASLSGADLRDLGYPWFEYSDIGFRVSQVPAPGSIALLAIGGLVTAGGRRRR